MIADILLGAAGVIFILSLIPQIARNYKRKSSGDISGIYLGMYIVGIVCLGVGYYILCSPIAFITNAVAFVGYAILLIQKVKYNNHGIQL